MMFVTQMAFNTFLFLFGLICIFLNRRHFLLVLVGIEVVLLSLVISFLVFAVHFDDGVGIIFSIFILAVAAAESATGLALIILYHRATGTILITTRQSLKS